MVDRSLPDFRQGDAREVLADMPENSVHAMWTSPPYFNLRDYEDDSQIGLEDSLMDYVDKLVDVFDAARDVLRPDGTLWLNLGDRYVGGNGHLIERTSTPDTSQDQDRPDITNLDPTNLMGIPWRVAFALQEDGWYLRQDVIWAKGVSKQPRIRDRFRAAMCEANVHPSKVDETLDTLDLYTGNPLPESVETRPTWAHEHIFMLTPGREYYYDHHGVREPSDQHDSGIHERLDDQTLVDRGRTQTTCPTSNVPWQGATRNLRNVWCVPVGHFPEAHFAVAPEEIVEPCIQASTSAYGCCAECGAPYRRVLDRDTRGDDVEVDADRKAIESDRQNRHRSVWGDGEGQSLKAYDYETEGWVSTCDCNTTRTEPPIVLDPFTGAGTTNLVAFKMGRRSIGIDLNDEYLDMARQRIDEYRQEHHAAWTYGGNEHQDTENEDSLSFETWSNKG